ncbi:MAG: hypothetical protein PF690_07525 [Deltaproteobacteria bacterium]|jgi:hypothetical protein|nr:hypothetical protein [Deltaproteobacteria bacterium]
MCNNNRNFQIKDSKKVPCLSFKELDNYFSDPDLKIHNQNTISAQQFTKDLDSMIDSSTKKLGLYGRIDNFSITIDSNTTQNGKQCHLINSAQKCEKFKLHKIFSKLFKYEDHPITKIKIKSWNFTDFDDTEKFQVGKLYSIKPVSVTYNSTQQDYKYNKQIISEFCIEEANGNIKKLKIIDNIKKGKIKKEKYIDGQKVNRQYYNLEIRHHNLNRGLMKAFLFYQIYKHKTSEYDQNDSLCNNKTDLKFVVAQPTINVSCQTNKTAFSTQKAIGKVPEEYIKISVFEALSQNQKKAVDINNLFNLQNEFDNDDVVDDNVQVQEIYRKENASIYTADGYNDLNQSNRLIFI